MHRTLRLRILIVGLVALLTLATAGILAYSGKFSNASAQSPDAVLEPDAPSAISQVLSYQGRLLTPGTGVPKADGAYQMTFKIYKAATGGSALWTETKSVSTLKGSFSTLLGNTTPLILGNFNGQELYLGVKVGNDAESTPRQRLAHTAYAMWTENAAKANTAIHATTATTATTATNADYALTAGDADFAYYAETLDGIDSVDFAPANHTHDGTSIVDESIGDADIQNKTRSISFSANALNYDDTEADITQDTLGLRWSYGYTGTAFVAIPRPLDWDGSSNVTLDLYFITTSATAGSVAFFTRPRSFNPGDTFGIAPVINGPLVPVASNLQVAKQSFTIPAASFGSKSLWMISLQRTGTSPETYTDDVILSSVGLSYTAVR